MVNISKKNYTRPKQQSAGSDNNRILNLCLKTIKHLSIDEIKLNRLSYLEHTKPLKSEYYTEVHFDRHGRSGYSLCNSLYCDIIAEIDNDYKIIRKDSVFGLMWTENTLPTFVLETSFR